ERLRALVAAPVRLESREELVNQRGAGEWHAHLARRAKEDREILLLVPDRERRLEVTVEHLLPEDLERPRRRGARRQRAVERRERQPVLLGEDERLGDREEVARDENLIRRLPELPGAGGTERRDALAHRLEDGPRLLDRALLAADEEDERSLDRALLPARDRRVEE